MELRKKRKATEAEETLLTSIEEKETRWLRLVQDISEGIRGAVTGDGVNGVSYMLYADDLSLTTNDPGEMQVMLKILRAYAMRKGLTVNASKSE
eukprot:1153151-Pelagomonas_calceolata.AAC.1